jgi:hypothetical protein
MIGNASNGASGTFRRNASGQHGLQEAIEKLQLQLQRVGMRMRRRSGKMPDGVHTYIRMLSLWSPLPGATRAKPSGIAGCWLHAASCTSSTGMDARISNLPPPTPQSIQARLPNPGISAHCTRQLEVLSSPTSASPFASFLMELAAHFPSSMPSPYFRPR